MEILSEKKGILFACISAFGVEAWWGGGGGVGVGVN